MEILFRGKSVVASSPNTPGYWMKGNLFIKKEIVFGEDTECYHILDGYEYIDGPDCDTEVWPEIVGQYVGLKDCAGRKIFEGDILESPVKRCDQRYGNLIIINDIRECKFAALFVAEYRVIGNIHDNPELLKVEG